MARRMKMGGAAEIGGGEEEGRRKEILQYIDPTYGVVKAATNINEPMDIRLRRWGENDTTVYHIYGTRGSYYDSNSTYRDIVSGPSTVAIEVRLPKTKLSEMKVGDLLEIGGKVWGIKEISTFGNKFVRVSSADGNQEIMLQDGNRINMVGSGDRNYNWKVAITGARNADEARKGISSSNQESIWIFNEDALIGMRYTAGDSIDLPTYFGGRLVYDGLVNNDKKQINFSIQYKSEFGVSLDGQTKTETLTVDCVQIKGEGKRFMYLPVGGNSAYADQAYYIPARETFLMKGQGDTYYREITLHGIESLMLNPSGNGEPTKIRYVRGAGMDLAMTEIVRNGVVVSPDGYSDISTLRLKTGPNGICFKRLDSEVGQIDHRFIYESSSGSFELPVVNARGSVWSNMSTTDATLQSSDEIAKAQWSLASGGTTGIEGWKVAPGEFELKQNYPNPFNPTTTIQFTLPKESHVKVKVFNLLGQEVTTLIDERHMAGTDKVVFDAGKYNLSSGIYLYQLEIDGKMAANKKMTLAK